MKRYELVIIHEEDRSWMSIALDKRVNLKKNKWLRTDLQMVKKAIKKILKS